MKRTVKGFYLKVTAIILSSAVVGYAGVLDNLDKELTGLVEKVRPYLVTVEAKDTVLDEVFVGSGILVNNDGYVLSTTSVVGEIDDIRVCFKDGAAQEATVIGVDYYTGLALLKIDEVNRDIPTIADSEDLKEGSWVIVIGNSYEIPSAVKIGIFSGLTNDGFLQLSVQAGPGSSGSAVFNTRGELIGLLVAQASETVSLFIPDNPRMSYASGPGAKPGIATSALGLEMPASGTSLAVPSAKLLQVFGELKERGEIKHSYLGIRQRPIEPEILQRMNLKTGVVVVDVIDQSPAFKVGLKPGDILVSFDDRTISGPGHLYGLVRAHKPGDEIELGIIRNGSKLQIDVVLSESPDEGYFNGTNNFQKNMAESYREFTRFSDSLSNKLRAARDKLLDDPEMHTYIDKLEEKIIYLEDEVEELSNKLENLYKEFKKE